MATPLLVLIILAIVIIASIITSVVTYVILSGRNKRIRLAEQYRQLGITEQYLKIQDEIERIIRYKDIKLTTASPVKMSNPEDGQNEKETVHNLYSFFHQLDNAGDTRHSPPSSCRRNDMHEE